jgi:hypothetical protein
MYSQDVTEGKGKSMKVIAEAGTFYLEKPTEESDENGKKIWEKTEIGTDFEGIIVYQRKQLRHYNSDTEQYTSSPIYDTDDDVIPLFRDKKEVDKGTPKELKGREEYQGLSLKGKAISKLEDNRVLYVLYEGELYQMSLRGTSMFAFLTYARKNTPSAYVTQFCSEAHENGKVSWNQMTFHAVREINSAEVKTVLEKQKEIQEGIVMEKNFYGQNAETAEDARVKREFDALGAPSEKDKAWN